MELTAAMIDADWEYFTPKVKVSYIPYDPVTDANISGSTVESIDAIIQEYTKSEAGGEDSAHNITRVWNLRAFQMPGVRATKRGIIQEADGTQWVIDSCSMKTIGTRWNCRCYALNG